jgi:penicillin G amidase
VRHWLHGGRGPVIAVTAVALVAAAVIPGGPAMAGARRAAAPGSQLPAAGQRVADGALSAVITRDSYGVPSIYASSMAGMWFGDGWAQAADRMVQLELTRRTVEGTLSGIFGPSELTQDEDVRTFF